MESMLMPYRKLYRLIEGRSDRREFWMFTLFVWIVAVAMVVLMAAVIGASAFSFDGLDPTNYGTLFAGAGVGFVGFIVVFYVWALLTGVASFAVTVRRLHDLNFSGWFLVLYYVILIAGAAIHSYLYFALLIGGIVVMALPGTPGPNKYETGAPGQAEAFA